MKNLLISLCASSLIAFSLSAFAEKLIITGTPITVEERSQVFVPTTTTTVTTGSDYYYVKMAGKERVCYQDVQPSLAKVDAGIFKFKLGTDEISVHCYDYNTEYFTVQ